MSELSRIVSFIEGTGPVAERRSFGFSGSALEMYLKWAGAFNYLFVDSCENDILGIGIAYPVARPFDGTREWFYSFSPIVPRYEESGTNLCIMDFVAKNKASRVRVINDFVARFPNWESQEKWALRKGVPVSVKNKTIKNLLNNGL